MNRVGFSSVAEGHREDPLDIRELLVKNPTSTFFVRIEGDSMIDAGIFSGDLLVIDKSLSARWGSVVLAVVESEFTLKRLTKGADDGVVLMPENPEYKPILISTEIDFSVWGVATYVIHQLHK